MLQELRAWLEKLTRLHLRNAEERVISDYEAGEHQRTLATLVRIDELERQHAERARAERVAEAKRAIIWAGMFIECLPDGSTQFDPQKMAEAYVASQEAAE